MEESDSFTLLSLNCWLFPQPFSSDCEARFENILKIIKEGDPDIIALQEVWSNYYLKRLKSRLLNYYVISGSSRFFNSSGLVLLTKTMPASFSIEDFKLSWRHNPTEWIFKKGFMQAVIHIGGVDLCIINTHLYAPFSKGAALIPVEQFQTIMRKVPNAPTIMCGDLNMSEDALESLTGKNFHRLCNSQITRDMNNPYSNARFNFSRAGSKKLDYVLEKGNILAKSEYKIIKQPYVSDHYPLLCRLFLKNHDEN